MSQNVLPDGRFLLYNAFAQGGFSGWFGFPISDVYSYETGERVDFEEGGYILTSASGTISYHPQTSPSSLLVTPFQNHFSLQWQDLSNIETGYQVHVGSTSPFLTLDTTVNLGSNTTNLQFLGGMVGETYAFSVTGIADTILSPPSNIAFSRLLNDSLDFYLNSAEYFFNTDPGVGSGTPIAVYPDDETTLVSTINVNLLNPGFHRLYLRYRDSRGVWSAAEGRTFYVTSPVPPSNQVINQAELFYDIDPGIGNGEYIPITANTDVNLVGNQDVFSLAPGFHRTYLRFKTNYGVWSAAEGRSLYITPNSGEGAFIAGGEIFFDNVGGYGSGIPMLAQDSIFDEPDEIAYKNAVVNILSQGQHFVYARVRDSRGLWSSVVKDTFIVTTPQSIQLVIIADSLAQTIKLIWNSFPSAMSYQVHFDTLSSGTFTNYLTVNAPDTTSQISVPPYNRRYFYVNAVLPNAIVQSSEQTQTEEK